MNPSRKRPLGITLLALPFLWIGCIGTLFFPFIILAGGMTTSSDALLSGFIHSPKLRLAIACVIGIVWYGGYVFYAFMGFGLWKLQRWAWKSALVIHILGVTIGLIAAICCYRIPLVAIAAGTFPLTMFGVALWYMEQPHVREAFQVEGWLIPMPSLKLPAWMRLPKLKTWMKVTLAITVGLTLFATSLLYGVETMFRKSDIYAITMNEAQKSPCAVGKLGAPLIGKGMILGSMETSADTGSADLEIPIRGPKGTGTLTVSAKKAEGIWNIQSLTLDAEGPSNQLIPTSACE